MSSVCLPCVTEENGPCHIYIYIWVCPGGTFMNSIPYADMCNRSRITQLEGLLIVQPYHPMLFQQGGLPGPELIMRFWRRQLRAEDLPAKWEEYEAAASKQQKRLDKMLWKCGACERELKATSFGVQVGDKSLFAAHVLERVLRRGACRYCVDCMQRRRAEAGGAAGGAAGRAAGFALRMRRQRTGSRRVWPEENASSQRAYGLARRRIWGRKWNGSGHVLAAIDREHRPGHEAALLIAQIGHQ